MPLINTLGMQVGSEKTGFANLRLGGALLRSGVGLFALGLTSRARPDPALLLRDAVRNLLGVVRDHVSHRVWPWALPLLATEGFALTLVALGLCLISQSRRESAVRPAHS